MGAAIMSAKKFFFVSFIVVFVLFSFPANAAVERTLTQNRTFAAKDYQYDLRQIYLVSEPISSEEHTISNINKNIREFSDRFTLEFSEYDPSFLPDSLYELDRCFIKNLSFSIPERNRYGKIEVIVTAEYNAAGRLLNAKKNNDTVFLKYDEEMKALNKVMVPLLKKMEELSLEDSVIYAYDYVAMNVKNKFDAYHMPNDAYDALVTGYANDEGYAESLQLIFTLLGLENEVVYSRLNNNPEIPHLFNKVKINGSWYNMDASLASTSPVENGVIRHGYCLVPDKITEQRYNWEQIRYPSSNKVDSWYHRNGTIITTQSTMEDYVKGEIQKKEKIVSFAISNYNKNTYSFDFIKLHSEVNKAKISRTGIANKKNDTPIQTYWEEIIVQIIYK